MPDIIKSGASVPGRDGVIELGPALSTGDTLLEAIVNSLHDELLVIDRDFKVVFVNRSLLGHLGKSEREVIGNCCYRILYEREAPCQLPENECPLKAVFQTGNPVTVTRQYMSGTPDKKTEKYMNIIASPITDSQGKVIAVTELRRDVTEAKLMEMRMAETYRDLLALGTISSVVSESLNLTTVLEGALDNLLEIMKTDIGGILLLDEEKQMLCYQVHRGFSSNYVAKVCYPLDEDIDGQVFKTGEMFMAEDIMSDPWTIHSDLIKAEGLKSLISVPLRVKGQVLGVINVASRTPRRFSPEDIHFLSSAAPQIAMAVENAKLHQEVEYKEQLRGELLREIFSIQEEERRRIARELHDETSQALAGLAASLEVPLGMRGGDLAKIKAEIRKAQSISIGILGEIHKLIYDLRPTVLDDLGLVAAIRSLATNMLGAEGIAFSFRTSGRVRRLPSSSEASLYRAIQEAITNIVRHSNAKNAVIVIKFTRNDINIHIDDDGCGFDVEEAINSRERPRGLGLLGMKERVEFMGGRLDIHSQPNSRGTSIDIQIPLVCYVPVNSVRADGKENK